jgi:hypothetical protein
VQKLGCTASKQVQFLKHVYKAVKTQKRGVLGEFVTGRRRASTKPAQFLLVSGRWWKQQDGQSPCDGAAMATAHHDEPLSPLPFFATPARVSPLPAAADTAEREQLSEEDAKPQAHGKPLRRLFVCLFVWCGGSC